MDLALYAIHLVVIFTAFMHTVTSQVVTLSKCYKCANAPTNEARRYLEEVKEDYRRIGYTDFDDVLSPCGDPFTREAGINLRTCDNGYGCIKTRMELANKQIVVLRGCAKYDVCNGGRINNAPTPRWEVKVNSYCCHEPYCNESCVTKSSVLLMLLCVLVTIRNLVLR